MFDSEFYPTPVEIVRKMIASYQNGISKRFIIEPSAGKGDIIKAEK